MRASLSLHPPDPEEWAREAFWPLEEEADDAFFKIQMSTLVYFFASLLEINHWYFEWEESQRTIAAIARETAGA